MIRPRCCCVLGLSCRGSLWNVVAYCTAILFAGLVAPASHGQCGSAEAGGCCVPHPSPFCDDLSCCTAVCALDPFCCLVRWDDRCAIEAFEVCNECQRCGAFAAGACCSIHGNPFCDDAGCCDTVCAIDPACCVIAWDVFCVTLADEHCFACPEVCPAEAECCAPHDGPGCDTPACCAAVCEVSPYCCTIVWDALCVHQSKQYPACPCNQLFCAGDLTGDAMVDGDDLAIILGGWGSIGAADLDDNGVVGHGDLTVLFGGWGPCPQ